MMSRLKLPAEMIDIIKDYCFPSIEQVAKQNKSKINKAITSFQVIRVNHDDNNPRWGVEFPIGNQYGDTFVMDACFCEFCGNYNYNTVRNLHMRVYSAPSIYCNCSSTVGYPDYPDDNYFNDPDQEYWENYARENGYFG